MPRKIRISIEDFYTDKTVIGQINVGDGKLVPETDIIALVKRLNMDLNVMTQTNTKIVGNPPKKEEGTETQK